MNNDTNIISINITLIMTVEKKKTKKRTFFNKCASLKK